MSKTISGGATPCKDVVSGNWFKIKRSKNLHVGEMVLVSIFTEKMLLEERRKNRLST